MPDCIDCGKMINGEHIGVTICSMCVAKREKELNNEERIAMAKVGLDALIDEVTKYQEVRPKGELKQRYNKYLGGKDG